MIDHNNVIHALLRLPATGALVLIRAYQVLLSPLKAGIFGPGAACRFYPSCSDYGLEAIRQHGLLSGIRRTSWRILKCHPFHPGGFDPVPPRPTDERRNKQTGCPQGCSHKSAAAHRHGPKFLVREDRS